MSKVITARFECATFDDAAPGANLTGNPPSYPPTLDQYNSTTVGNAAAGYGVINVGSPSGAAVQSALPGTAGGYIVAPTSNTTMISIAFQAPTVPGGAAVNIAILCGPGQTVSLPAAWLSPWLMINACTPSGASAVTVPFACQILWSF